MIDFDLTTLESELTIRSSITNYKCEINMRGEDSGDAVIVRTMDTQGNGKETQLLLDKKAARLVINFLQTYFEL